jgi:hypothetical protein
MLKKIGLAVGGLLVVLLGVIATRPDTYRVERSTTINASQDAVFAIVSDFHRGAEWSPWEKLDPQMTKTFTGKAGDIGHGFTWSGNDKAGEGAQTITEISAPNHVAMKLEFKRPMADVADTGYNLSYDGKTTAITWYMAGNHNFISKAMCLVMDMDTMIGSEFEKGLASLKALAETEATAASQSRPAAVQLK